MKHYKVIGKIIVEDIIDAKNEKEAKELFKEYNRHSTEYDNCIIPEFVSIEETEEE